MHLCACEGLMQAWDHDYLSLHLWPVSMWTERVNMVLIWGIKAVWGFEIQISKQHFIGKQTNNGLEWKNQINKLDFIEDPLNA